MEGKMSDLCKVIAKPNNPATLSFKILLHEYVEEVSTPKTAQSSTNKSKYKRVIADGTINKDEFISEVHGLGLNELLWNELLSDQAGNTPNRVTKLEFIRASAKYCKSRPELPYNDPHLGAFRSNFKRFIYIVATRDVTSKKNKMIEAALRDGVLSKQEFIRIGLDKKLWDDLFAEVSKSAGSSDTWQKVTKNQFLIGLNAYIAKFTPPEKAM